VARQAPLLRDSFGETDCLAYPETSQPLAHRPFGAAPAGAGCSGATGSDVISAAASSRRSTDVTDGNAASAIAAWPSALGWIAPP
jgi:hypothetical protein